VRMGYAEPRFSITLRWTQLVETDFLRGSEVGFTLIRFG